MINEIATTNETLSMREVEILENAKRLLKLSDDIARSILLEGKVPAGYKIYVDVLGPEWDKCERWIIEKLLNG